MRLFESDEPSPALVPLFGFLLSSVRSRFGSSTGGGAAGLSAGVLGVRGVMGLSDTLSFRSFGSSGISSKGNAEAQGSRSLKSPMNGGSDGLMERYRLSHEDDSPLDPVGISGPRFSSDS